MGNETTKTIGLYVAVALLFAAILWGGWNVCCLFWDSRAEKAIQRHVEEMHE